MNDGPAYGSDWRVFVLGYAALFVLLIALVDAGAPADLAAAIALSIAGGATVLYLPAVLKNLTTAMQTAGITPTQTEGGTSNGGTQ